MTQLCRDCGQALPDQPEPAPPPVAIPREARNRMMDAFESKGHSMQAAYDALVLWWMTERPAMPPAGVSMPKNEKACRIESPAVECGCGLGQCRKGLIL